MAHEAGKGSKQRPTDQEAYSSGWDRIFGKNKQQDKTPEQTNDKESLTMPMPGTAGSAKIVFKDD